MENPRREGYREDVIPRGPPEVLHHLPVRRPSELNDGKRVAWVAAHEDDVRRLYRDVRASADGDPDVRLDESRRDSVSGNG